MNNEKAREFFSAYYEGTLDLGLQQTFEQKLRSDAELMADYSAFVETMNELDAMRYEEIEVPSFLSDRIATRVEEVAEKTRAKTPVWALWLRGLTLGATATAALAFAFINLSSIRTEGPVATGSPLSVTDLSTDHLTFNYSDGTVRLRYKPSTAKTIVVSSGVSGVELKRFELGTSSLDSALENSMPDPALFDVQVQGEDHKTTIAVPGKNRSSERAGSGDLKKFAAAFSAFYRVPVLLEIDGAVNPVTWDFQQTDAREAATAAVANAGYSVDQRPSGMIVIMDR